MDDISIIISLLSEEEKRDFITYLQQKNRRTDTKNIQLFQLLDTTKKIKNPDIILYGKASKNTYYALYKRLYDTLIDFVATKSFENETSEELEIFKMVLASRIFFEHKKHKIAFKTIDKAEKKATAHDFYSILGEIYQTKIQYAHLPNSEPLEGLITKFRANQQLVQQEEHLNLVYAIIKKQLLIGDIAVEQQDIAEIITQTLTNHNIIISDALTFKSLYQLMDIGTNVATARRDYYTILPFIISAYDIVLKKPRPPHKHLFYQIAILYMMSNALFRNKEFKLATLYLNTMEQLTQEQSGKHYASQSGKLFLLKALITNYTGDGQKAIQILEDYQKTKPYKTTDVQFQLQLALMVFYFQQANFKEAFSTFRSFPHSDKWYTEHIGQDWVIKKQLIEILLHTELGNINLVDSRLKSFQRKHYPYLRKIREPRVIAFVQLVTSYYKYPETSSSQTFVDKVESAFDWKSPKQEDIYVMSFYAWLKNKMTKGDLYQTTLTLVNKK